MLHIGVLKTWNSTDYQAGVQLAGSITTYLDAVNVARNIADGDMVIGRQVIVAIPGGNPKDSVIIAVFTV